MTDRKRVLALFDVDGTLSPARQTASPHMTELLLRLREKIYIGVVGGSDLVKQQEQLGADCLQRWADVLGCVFFNIPTHSCADGTGSLLPARAMHPTHQLRRRSFDWNFPGLSRIPVIRLLSS